MMMKKAADPVDPVYLCCCTYRRRTGCVNVCMYVSKRRGGRKRPGGGAVVVTQRKGTLITLELAHDRQGEK